MGHYDECTFSFCEAIRYIKEGRKVFRLGWIENTKPIIIPDFPLYIPENRVEINNEFNLIYIKTTRGEVGVCDLCDKDIVFMKKSWNKIGNGYLAASRDKKNNKSYLLHKLIITNVPIGYCIDHINGNKLDNRRCNLRIASKKQNSINSFSRGSTSKYKGVSYDSSRNKWISSIQENGKTKHIGRFLIEEDAAIAYDEHSYKKHGEYAKLNFKERAVEPRIWVSLKNDNTNEFVNNQYIYLKTEDDNNVLWTPSQTDLLSSDWVVVSHEP